MECRDYIQISSLKKAKQTPPKYIFTPDKELITFANEFSKNYKKVKAGIYASESETYIIWYKDKLVRKDTLIDGEFIELDTPVRISNKKQIIEISRSKILRNNKYNTDFIFFLIIWSIAIVEIPTHDYQDADAATIRYYLTTKKSRKNILKGYLEMFRFSTARERNKQRLICIEKLLSR